MQVIFLVAHFGFCACALPENVQYLSPSQRPAGRIRREHHSFSITSGFEKFPIPTKRPPPPGGALPPKPSFVLPSNITPIPTTQFGEPRRPLGVDRFYAPKFGGGVGQYRGGEYLPPSQHSAGSNRSEAGGFDADMGFSGAGRPGGAFGGDASRYGGGAPEIRLEAPSLEGGKPGSEGSALGIGGTARGFDSSTSGTPGLGSGAKGYYYSVFGRPGAGSEISIIRYESVNNGDGTYQYLYETGNGIKVQQQGDARGNGTKAQGSYSYTSPEGYQVQFQYTSGEKGFNLQGARLPTRSPPVNGGSPAERAGLIAGDAVIKINNVDVFNLLHKEAQDVIVRAGSSFDMVIQRGGSTWKPSVVPTGTFPKPSPVINNVSPVTKTSLAANKSENIGAIGTGHNLSARPFNTQVNGAVNGGPKLVNKQYNSPLKLYSEDAIAESLSAQTEVLSTGALGVNFKKNEKGYDASNSEVYRMLQESENDRDTHDEPDSGIVTAPNKGMAGLRHVEAPINRPPPANPQLPPGQNICADCERLIVGVFVRIKDKNLHVECFKCATCGSSLKNVGYYNINNKLYCDIHAKAAAIAINNPSAIPVTIPPGGRAPASAISQALSSHPLPTSQLSPKAPSYTSPYQPAEELKDALPTSDGLSSAPISSLLSVDSTPSTESNIKPSSNSSLFNPSAPISFSKYINKSSNISGPKPFGSVSAPLSPGSNFSRAAPLSPQSNFNKAPVSPSAPSYGSYSPSSTAGRSINITWPPIHEDPEVPTACPLFYPPPSKVEAELEKKVATKHQSKFESEYFADESEDINMDETMSFYSEELSFSGRRSATECVEILSETLDKQKLVENVIKSSPQLILPPLNMDEKKYSTETNGFSSCTMNLPKTEYCQEQDSCALKRPIQYTPNTIECQLPSKVENAVPLKWESSLTQAVRTVAPDLDTFSRIHSRHSRHSASPMASALAIAPAQPFNPLNHGSTEPVPLPEETEPYFPPEIPILPVQFEEKKKDEKPPAPKPKSHFIKALEIAPERPFTPVGGVAALPAVKKKPKDPLDKLIEDLPKPSEKLDMRSALTTAPERSYTPQITEYSTSSDNLTKQQKIHNIDRSQLTKPLKPEELPASFKINIKEPKPPSYYSPAVIEERISSKLQESTSASENKETKIVEKETIQPAEIVQPIITTIQEPQSTNFAPLFQGFTCSFKNKTEHSQFSVEVCTTPPVPTPPPKPQTPISYIATVEQKPGYITREKIIQESSDVRQTTRREENIEHESKLKSETNQQLEIQKQAEEIVQVKTLPVTTMLHKAENIPSYQLDLQATAESELRIMKKKRLAEERLEQQKKEREQKQIQQSMQKNMEYSQEDIKNTQEYSMQQETTQYSQHHQISNQQNMQQISAKLVPVKPERHHITKPIITVEPSEMNNVAEKVSFQGESHDKPPSRTFSPRPRSMTPSMINKAPPLLPYYQDSLVPHYHAAVESNVLEPTTPDISRSPSPHPEMRSQSPSPLPIKARQERAKSPAQGPPPNPLQSSRPLPTREDLKIQQAKENLKTYIPEYKSHQETMEQKMEAYVHRKDQDFQENSSSQISQNVAYPVTCFENQFSVQTGNVQQQVKTIGQQQLQVANTQKHLTEAKKTATGSSTIDYSEESRQEQLAGRCQSQSQSNEKSADGRVQIQRKKIVTEEYERSHKETNIQIEKNITSTAGKYPFTKVNAPSVEPPSVHSFHVTNPHHIKSKDDITTKHTQNTLQQASQKLEESSQSQLAKSDVQIESQLNSDPGTLSQPTAPQPPIRHVYAPNTIAPVKHVSAPSACQKPSQKITKPTIPKTDIGSGTGRQSGGITAAPRRGRGLLNAAAVPGTRVPLCGHCHGQIRGPFITALGKIWCPQHFICATPSCRRPLQDLGFVEEKGQLYCEYCFEQYLAPPCSKCNAKIKGDCLKAIGKNFHPECFNCVYCGKLFANSPFFLEDGNPYCEADWNELFTTKCYACGFPVEAGDRWVEALNNNYHSQCFNCTMCKKNLEGQSFFAKGGRPFCKNHAR